MRLLAAVLLVSATAAAQDISLRPIATGLEMPVAVTHVNDWRLFITLQRGEIVIFDGAQILPTPFLDIRSIVQCCGERGLLSVAFHPHYAENGFFFIDYIDGNGDIDIARYKVSTDPNLADANSGTVLLTIPHRDYSNHNGGQLAFGPDGYLYAGTGDGGSGGDPLNNGQNLQALLGKLLRIDVDNGSPYGIPASNPFVARTDARHEIWAWGLRNPWRFSFDRQTGDLLIGDVGQNAWEEIDFQPVSSAGGENYGWRIMEGLHCYNATTCNQSGLVLPVIEYGHTNGACSVTGGYRYRGTRSSRLRGVYIYADYCNGIIWGATRMQNGTWTSAQLFDAPFNINAFGEDVNGEIYVVDYAGRVLLIEDPLAPAITTIAPGSGRSTGGESITISGTSLTNPSSVTFGGATGTVTASSDHSITVTTPPAPALGAVDVVVTTTGGTATSAGGFRYDLGAPATVTATSTTATSVTVSWSAVPGATSYEVTRSTNGTTPTTVTTGGTTLTDPAAAANTADLYEVRAAAAATSGPFSAPDLATTVIFTDDPLIAATTIVKAQHVMQLRTAVNAVRALSGAGAFGFSDPTLTSGATTIRAVHLSELRAKLAEARAMLALPALSYTDPTVTAGSTLIKAVHFTELRNGVK